MTQDWGLQLPHDNTARILTMSSTTGRCPTKPGPTLIRWKDLASTLGYTCLTESDPGKGVLPSTWRTIKIPCQRAVVQRYSDVSRCEWATRTLTTRWCFKQRAHQLGCPRTDHHTKNLRLWRCREDEPGDTSQRSKHRENSGHDLTALFKRNYAGTVYSKWLSTSLVRGNPASSVSATSFYCELNLKSDDAVSQSGAPPENLRRHEPQWALAQSELVFRANMLAYRDIRPPISYVINLLLLFERG